MICDKYRGKNTGPQCVKKIAEYIYSVRTGGLRGHGVYIYSARMESVNAVELSSSR
jgi:hypothetical protein